MQILVTGGRGMFGEAVREVFKENELIITDWLDLDVRRYDEVMRYMDNLPGVPDYVLHLAAETNLEYCQNRVQDAYFTNTIGTQNMVRFAQLLDIPIIYMSTAGVFSGRSNKGYKESDLPNPVNHYGRSKYYGELAVRQYEKHYIFRMGWAMGCGPKVDHKFVNLMYQQIKKGEKRLTAINDRFGNPTYTHDVARTIQAYIKAKVPYGTYHVSGKGVASRFDVAQHIVEILKSDALLLPVPSAAYSQTFSCPRATNEILINEVDMGELNQMRDWRDALTEYLRRYYL